MSHVWNKTGAVFQKFITVEQGSNSYHFSYISRKSKLMEPFSVLAWGHFLVFSFILHSTMLLTLSFIHFGWLRVEKSWYSRTSPDTWYRWVVFFGSDTWLCCFSSSRRHFASIFHNKKQIISIYWHTKPRQHTQIGISDEPWQSPNIAFVIIAAKEQTLPSLSWTWWSKETFFFLDSMIYSFWLFCF